MLRRCLLLILCLGCTLAFAAPASLNGLVAKLAANPALRGARVGVFVQSLDNGDIWIAERECETFVPASTAKLVTGALALEYLKPEYRFVTRVTTTGAVVDGVVQGDIILCGRGDPTLIPGDLQALAQALAAGDPARGIPPIRAVTGRLLINDTFFPQPGALLGPGWEQGDLPWYYAAPACALSCHRNAVTITVQGTAAGARPSVTLTPDTTCLQVVNRAATRSSVKTGAIEVMRSGQCVTVNGRIAPGKTLTERVSVPDPATFTAEQFRRALTIAGIEVRDIGQQQTTCSGPPTLLLAEHTSVSLGEILSLMLKESDNHIAEQLRWTLLALYSLETPLDVRYPAMLRDFCAHSGLLEQGIYLVDGCGLSRQNGVSPLGLARILTYMRMSKDGDYFVEALPIAGVDGTLKMRMQGTAAEGNVRAKTGTMRGVSSLAGYVTTKAGEHLVFAIMVNGHQHGSQAARTLQDQLVNALAECQGE